MDSPESIPMAMIFAAANRLREKGVIQEWALGGALAGIYYVEPFTTYDADIFFVPAVSDLTAGIPLIFRQLQEEGWTVQSEHLLARGFPVQFLAAHGLTEDAVRKARAIEFDGVPGRVFTAEHIVAIAASVGRLKDRARIELMFQQAELDKSVLDQILGNFSIHLPPP